MRRIYQWAIYEQNGERLFIEVRFRIYDTLDLTTPCSADILHVEHPVPLSILERMAQITHGIYVKQRLWFKTCFNRIFFCQAPPCNAFSPPKFLQANISIISINVAGCREFGSLPDHLSVEIRAGGSVAQFRCDQWHDMVGSSSLKCLGSGEWSNPVPTCQGIKYLLTCYSRLSRKWQGCGVGDTL